jgi:hypothetical protein
VLTRSDRKPEGNCRHCEWLALSPWVGCVGSRTRSKQSRGGSRQTPFSHSVEKHQISGMLVQVVLAQITLPPKSAGPMKLQLLNQLIGGRNVPVLLDCRSNVTATSPVRLRWRSSLAHMFFRCQAARSRVEVLSAGSSTSASNRTARSTWTAARSARSGRHGRHGRFLQIVR